MASFTPGESESFALEVDSDNNNGGAAHDNSPAEKSIDQASPNTTPRKDVNADLKFQALAGS